MAGRGLLDELNTASRVGSSRRVAIVGAGVSGLVAAKTLDADHDVTLFEGKSNAGGHVHTVRVQTDSGDIAVDMGFIVYNDRNYPHFSALLDQLAVETQPSAMSFSVRLASPDLEYNGTTLSSLFIQRRNLIRPWFHRMLVDILRFGRQSPRAVRGEHAESSLGEYLAAAGLSRAFMDCYLVPMGAALWSMPQSQVLEMPAAFFVRFFENHGMLTVNDRPEWRVVSGGSARYVDRLIAGLRGDIRTGHRVREIRRYATHVTVDGERFDEVVIACHSDDALAMLGDPSVEERSILGAIPYNRNEAVLHTDTSVLPRRRAAWGAWNYHSAAGPGAPVAVTYNMNILQSLRTRDTYCVTLNDTASIDPGRVLEQVTFRHPVFNAGALAAQKRHLEISGKRHTHYCGAYWGNGFHEDGAASAIRACKRLAVAA